MNANRDAWTDYANRNGLIRDNSEGRRGIPISPDGVAPTLAGNKYRAEPITVDGVRFASKKEAARFLELRLLEKQGLIDQLERQPVFPLHLMQLWRSQVPIQITTIGRYTADFRYRDLGVWAIGEIVVEDVKSSATKTEAYSLRKRAAEIIHGIHVREV